VLARRGQLGAVRVAVTDRAGGVSAPPYESLNLADHVGDEPAAVTGNRARVAGALGVDRQQLVWMHQVHGREVAVVDHPPTVPPTADALITTRAGLVLGVLVADCVPLLLADPVRGIAAAVHVGRRGLVAGVVPAVLATLRTLGAGALVGWIGPSICAGCYEVPEAMCEEVARVVPAAVARTRIGTPAIDLAAGVRAQLGPTVDEVRDLGGCTREDPAWYSYRRDGVTGRQAGLIWIEHALGAAPDGRVSPEGAQ
jgi:YfiH family protein